MRNGAAWSPIFPLPKPRGALGSILYARSARSLTSSPMWSGAALSGDCWRTSSLQQEDRLPLLSLLAFGWNMGKDARCPAKASAGPPQEKPSAQRSHRRQSVGQNDRGGRRATRIRWRQEGQRAKTPLAGLHAGFGAQRARVHSAEVEDLKRASCSCWRSPRGIVSLSASLTCGWTPLYTGEEKGADWVQKVLGWTAEIVRHPPKLVPDEVMRTWVKELDKEGVHIDQEKLQEPQDTRPFLPIRWIVERTFSWLGQNRRMSKDYEQLPESAEAFIYAAMSRLMVRRLARS